MNAVIDFTEETDEVTAWELRSEAAEAAASFPAFLALYSTRGPVMKLLETGEIDREIFNLCGVTVTELTEAEANAILKQSKPVKP